MGTAGGLHKFQQHILSGSLESFFVLHCDICCNFQKLLPAMLEFHRSKVTKGGVATLMGSKVKPEYASHYGCLIEDEQQHLLTHYAEKPATFVSDLINSGIYCFSPKIFDYIQQVVTRHEVEKEEEDYLRLSLYVFIFWLANHPLTLPFHQKERNSSDRETSIVSNKRFLYL